MLISLFLWWAHAAEAGGWAGSAVCRSCHEAQYSQQMATPHAGALARAPDARYEWAFGAAAQATTYVSKYDEDHYVEHRLSYYTATGRLAPTPGHEHQPEPGVLYRLFSPGAEILRCFQCHSTGPLRITGERRIEPFEAGVRCEVCHGAGAAHARAPAKTNILNPKRYSAAEVNQFCGACHRKPAPSGESTDFRDPWNARHQPLYFAESACYQKSGGRLSCLTCHPPHGGAVKDSCGNCHDGRHKANVAVGGKSCAACHMPPVKPRPELSFANHWIGVYRVGETLTPRRR